MKLSLLYQREPFPEIFTRTLNQFISSYSLSDAPVTWNDRPIASDNFYANSRLNIIYPASCSFGVLFRICVEYSFNSNIFLRFIQFCYVFISCLPLTRFLLSDASVFINADSAFISKLFIIPGNHSIRLLDYANNQSIVLHKNGFNLQFFKSVINLKSTYPALPTPKLFDYNICNGWYTEEIISGLPLNRIANLSHKSSTFKAASDALLSLYSQSLEFVDCKIWTTSLSAQISSLTERMKDTYPPFFVKDVTFLVQILSRSVLLSESYLNRLPICLTHGDFQSGNILKPTGIQKSDVYLIDWEYSSKRIIWYDSFVFYLNSRAPKGLSQRLAIWLSSPKLQHYSLGWLSSIFELYPSSLLLHLFLLEDILVRLLEVNSSSSSSRDSGLLLFLHELKVYLTP